MFHRQYAKNFYAHLFLHALTPGMITYFMRQMAKASNLAWSSAQRQLAQDIESLESHIDDILPVCTPEHTASGLAYLNNLAYTPKGKIRNTANAKLFQMSDLLVLAVPLRIRLVGFTEYNCGGGGSYRSAFMAQYRVESEHAYFTYVMRPWQSGAHFEIIDRGEELP